MTREEYEKKSHENVYFSGYGLETKTHMPCPGCGEADFVTLPVLDALASFQEGATCQHCGRGFKAIVTSDSNVTRFEVVQTSGPDLPDYLQWMRRM